MIWRACKFLFRPFAWLLAAAVTFATLGPPEDCPHSNLGQIEEYALALVLSRLASLSRLPTRATGRRRPRSPPAGGALELLQLFVPGRHARVEDFLVDLSAAQAGFAIVASLDFVAVRIQPVEPDWAALEPLVRHLIQRSRSIIDADGA